MSFTKIMIHAVWGTKKRVAMMTSDIRPTIIQQIRTNAISKGIYIDRLNGHHDHLHCLMDLHPDISLSKVLQLIKGESAYWINQQSLISSRFEWAEEYYAVSVSESMLEQVRWYIDGQEIHHKKVTFQQEYEEFIKEYNDLKGLW